MATAPQQQEVCPAASDDAVHSSWDAVLSIWEGIDFDSAESGPLQPNIPNVPPYSATDTLSLQESDILYQPHSPSVARSSTICPPITITPPQMLLASSHSTSSNSALLTSMIAPEHPSTYQGSPSHYSSTLDTLVGPSKLNPTCPAFGSPSIITLLNCRSAIKHAHEINTFLIEYRPLVLALTETWFSDCNLSCLHDILPPNYDVVLTNRLGKIGGGVALIHHSSLSIIASSPSVTETFEALVVQAAFAEAHSITFVILYHPPRQHSTFLQLWQPFCESLVQTHARLLILGDFNLHIDDLNDQYGRDFCSLMSDLDLFPMSTSNTHELGHQLDLVIPFGIKILDLCHLPLSWSDHHLLLFSIKSWSTPQSVSLPKPPKTMKWTRPLKKLTLPAFSRVYSELRQSVYCPPALDDQYDWLISLITQSLDVLAPKTLKQVSSHTGSQGAWFSDEIHKMRNVGRILERRWRASKLPSDRAACRKHQATYKAAINLAKSTHLNSQIQQAKSSASELFRIASKYSSKPTNQLSTPPIKPSAEELSVFFSSKVAKIRETISKKRRSKSPSVLSGSRSPSKESHPVIISPADSPPTIFSHFDLLTPESVLKILLSLRNSTAPDDLLPTHVFKKLAPAFIQDLTSLVNHSLAAGLFPTAAKFGTVIPLIKKDTLPTNETSSYRPITLLPLIARLLEKIVTLQLQRHLEQANILHDRQSGFRPLRGTESAAIDILQHLLRIREAHHPAALILLDLSAAFDTIDHSLLLARLASLGGLSGPVLNWFQSFLQDRIQQVRIDQEVALPTNTVWGVPQGSALSPLLFNVYMVPLTQLIQSFGLIFQTYADDTQIVLDLHPSENDTRVLPAALMAIQSWMEENWLCLNEAKTELLLSGLEADAAVERLSWPSAFGSCPVPAPQVRNLGVLFNSNLNCVSHAARMVSAGHFQLNRLRSVLPLLSEGNRKTLCSALVLSRLDYCSLFFVGAPKNTLQKLQALQNRTIRAIKRNIPWNAHLSTHRKQLNWLPVARQHQLKLATLAWSIHHKQGPVYLQSWVAPPVLSTTTSKLRSVHRLCLPTPLYRRERLGGRSLQVLLPRIWNPLPISLKLLPTKLLFKKELRKMLLNTG